MTGASTISRRLALSGAGLALVSAWFAGMAYVYSAGPSLRQVPSLMSHTLFVPGSVAQIDPRDARGQTVLLAARSVNSAHGGALALVDRTAHPVRQDCIPACEPAVASTPATGKTDRSIAADARRVVQPASRTAGLRFDAIAASAALSPEKLAGLFARAVDPVDAVPAADAARFAVRTAMIAEPSPDRFGATAEIAPKSYILALAVPDADPLAADVIDPADSADEAQAIALPAPDAIPLPGTRPAAGKARPAVAADDPAPRRRDKPAPAAEKPSETVVAKRGASPRVQGTAPVELAYAPPDDGAGGVGKAFKNLFNTGPGVVGGKRVAVYNISAKTVTMPDGEVLQAFSGIGEMANNPKYAAVKMRGPTPPDTYKLRMRERRFHGVEAIRMLPVDGKAKHGRTGFLAHTELLRGRKGQSHGCVAFRDYDRFLNAFKKGKVTHMVVIPGNGKGNSGTKVASNAKSRS